MLFFWGKIDFVFTNMLLNTNIFFFLMMFFELQKCCNACVMFQPWGKNTLPLILHKKKKLANSLNSLTHSILKYTSAD